MDPMPEAPPSPGPRFDNSFVRELPGDPDEHNVPREVKDACYTRVRPTAMPEPALLAWSDHVAEMLGLDARSFDQSAFVRACGGHGLLPGMDPYAACYGGHQFGHWAAQLGDGRAITLGELVDPTGQRMELQVKGAGRTPYSRGADGRAVLRSSIREFLCSEAMHHLGVPTTRALCLIGTGEMVWRDLLYDGNARKEPGAIVCRVAPSFVRFGNFEIFAARRDHGRLRALTDYMLRTHFPELGPPGPDSYAALFEEVAKRTAILFVALMRVGFVHGVLNTDNMSLLGLCLDYGPFGFLDVFDRDFTPNTTDRASGRYRYGMQLPIAQWNLARLGSALLPLVGEPGPLERGLQTFARIATKNTQTMWTQKLGLTAFRDEGEGAGDELLVSDLETALEGSAADMSIFFRLLAKLPIPETAPSDEAATHYAAISECLYDEEEASSAEGKAQLMRWLVRYAARIREEHTLDDVRRRGMDAVNPKYVLRNYLAQLAIDRAELSDLSLVHELRAALERPYDEQPEKHHLAAKRPAWAKLRPGCGMLSCSS